MYMFINQAKASFWIIVNKKEIQKLDAPTRVLLNSQQGHKNFNFV